MSKSTGVEKSREVRLWITTVAVPIGLATTFILANKDQLKKIWTNCICRIFRIK